MRLIGKISRRALLALAGRGLLGAGGLLSLGGLVRFLGYQPDPPAPERIEIGSTADYAMNSNTVIPAVPALLIRGQSGFRAVSLSCSHLGCQLEVRPTQLVCPCHGSRFSLEGQVLQGPAVNALKELHVEVTEDEKLILYRS